MKSQFCGGSVISDLCSYVCKTGPVTQRWIFFLYGYYAFNHSFSCSIQLAFFQYFSKHHVVNVISGLQQLAV